MGSLKNKGNNWQNEMCITCHRNVHRQIERQHGLLFQKCDK